MALFESKQDREWRKKKERIDEIFTKTRMVRDKMSEHLRHFRGEIWDEEKLGEYDSKAIINMDFATVEAQAPLITDSRPITRVIPKRPFLQALADTYNFGIRYYWDTQELQDKIYKWVLDAKIMKKGIMKIFKGDEEGFSGIKCEIVDPRTFFIEPGYDDEWEAPRMGERVMLPFSWLEDNYPSKVKSVKESAVDHDQVDTDNQEVAKYGQDEEKKAGKYIRVYKIWERSSEREKNEDGEDVEKYPFGKWIIATDRTVLEEVKNEDNHGRPPYIGLDNYTDPHNFLSISDLDQIDELNKELNIQFQNWVKYSRKYHDPNYMIDANAFNDIDNYKATKDEGGQVYAVDYSMMGGKEPISPIKEGDLRPENLRLFDVIPSIIEQISGVTDVTKGVASSKEQSASEVAILAESSHTRIRQQVRNLEKALKRATWILVNMMQQYLQSPEIIHWTDEETGQVGYANLGNSKAQASDMIASQEIVQKGQEFDRLPPEMQNTPEAPVKMNDSEKQAWDDWKKFAEEYGEIDDFDPVYFGFEVEIETNSSLPLDKQSRANMMMQLANVHLDPSSVIDRLALLKIMQIPNAEEINKRLEEKEQAAMAGAMQGGMNG